MRRMEYLALKTDQATQGLFRDMYRELKPAAEMLMMSDASEMGGHEHMAFGNSFLKWLASFAAIYLLILDRTNWRTNMLTSLLVPYILFCLPESIFHLLRGEIGTWIAFVAVVLRLFFPRHFPDWLEIPGSLILLLVVAPHLFSNTLRYSWIGTAIDLCVGCYLLQEHIRASGGFRNAFTRSNGLSNTFGILLILFYPFWALLVRFV